MLSRVYHRNFLPPKAPVKPQGVQRSGAHGRPPFSQAQFVSDVYEALRINFFSTYNRTGHTFITLADAAKKVYDHGLHSVKQASMSQITEALKKADPRGVLEFDAATHRIFYGREKLLADKIAKFLKAPKRKMKAEVLARIESATTAEGYPLTAEQKQALKMAWVEPICIITGGPGTGKTTLQKILGELIRDFGGGSFLDFAQEARIAFLAPTGAAARRQAEVTGFDSQTIHKALYPKPDAFGKLRNTRKTIDHPWIAVDEVSMVDISLAYELVRICNPTQTHLVLFGDDQQLPSVGLGNVLADLKRVRIQGEPIPTVELTQVKRQSANSAIPQLAAAVQAQRTPDFSTLAGSEVSLEPQGPGEDMVDVVRAAIAQKKFDPTKSILLAYTNQMVWDLNLAIQEQCNPGGLAVQVDRQGEDGSSQYFKIRLGDRVVHLKNNYRLNVANGELGLVVDVNPDSKTKYLVVRYKGHSKDVCYTPEEVHELGLAYAITVHKSQGSEFAEVNLVLEPNMYRSLVYTAITRAKKQLRIFGNIAYLDAAVKRSENRQTTLADWIERLAATPVAPPISAGSPPGFPRPSGHKKPHPRQGGLFGN